MSKKKQNFHYHYAEQYETRAERRARSRRKHRYAVPPMALILSVVMLVLFGMISLTFSVYVTDSIDDPEMPSYGGLVVSVKNETVRDQLQSTNLRSKDDLAVTAANVDLAETSTFSNANGTVTVYFKDTHNWGSVYLYSYKSSYWDSNKGAGSYKTSSAYNFGPVQMTCIDSTNKIYSYTLSQYHTAYFAFTQHEQTNYENFSYTSACYLTNFDPATPLYTPSGNSISKNNTTYYNSGSWSAITNGTIPAPSGGSLYEVLTNSKVMFYYGDKWGSGTKYLNDGTTDITSGYTQTTATVDNSSVWYVYTTQESDTYYVSNNPIDTFAGKIMEIAPAGGELYYLYNDGININVRKTSTSTPAFSSPTSTVNFGSASPGVTCTVNSTSVIGKTNSILYYYTTDSGSTFHSFNFSDVSAFPVGEYTIYAVGYDGNIFARSSALTMTVRPVCTPQIALTNGGSVFTDQPETITLSHNVAENGGTLSITSIKNKSTNADASVYLTGASSPYTFVGAPAGTYVVTATCSSNSLTNTAEIEVSERPACYLGGLVGSSTSWGSSGTSMVYQGNNSNEYVTTLWLDPGKVYGQDSPYNDVDKYGFKIYYNSEYYGKSGYTSTHFTLAKPTGVNTSSSTTLSTGDGLSNLYLETGTYGGYYTITFNSSTKQLTVDYPQSAQYFLLGMGSDDNFWTDKLRSDPSFVTARKLADDGTCTISFTPTDDFTAGTKRGFKIYCTDGTYYGYQANSASYTINHSNASTSITLVSDTTDAYNLGFDTWYSGDYEFTFNTSTKAFSVTSSPSRSVTTTSIPAGISPPEADKTDNWNDTFTFSAADTQTHDFTGWSISGTLGTDYTVTAGSTSADSITIRVASPTAVVVTANWVYMSYDIYYHTVGGSLPTPTYTQDTANELYKGSYTYNPSSASLASLPTPTAPGGKTVDAIGWYEGTDVSTTYTTSVSSIPAGTYGEIHLWYYWQVTLTFKDNLDNSVLDTLTTALGTSAGADPTVNASLHPAFTFTAGDYSESWTSSTTMNDSKTIYVNYRPVTQAFTISLDTSADITKDGDVYHIPYGAKLSISAAPNAGAYDPYASDIVYYWSENSVDGWFDGLNTAGLNNFSAITTKKTDYIYTNPNITSLMTVASGTYTIYAKAYYPKAYGINGTSTNGFWSRLGQNYTLRYSIANPLQGAVTLSPTQKIYSSSNKPDLIAELSLSQNGYDSVLNATAYAVKTVLQHFVKGSGFGDIDKEDVDIGAGPDFTSTFDSTNISAGVHYYRIGMSRPKIVGFDAGTSGTAGNVYTIHDDTTNTDVIQYTNENYTSELYTTVDTASGSASRPLYLTIDGGVLSTPSNYRIMLFYIDSSGALKFQTAATFTRGGTTTYRFMIPDSVTQVKIGASLKTAMYVLPACDGSSIDFTDTYFDGYTAFTDVVTGEDSTPIQKLAITALNSTTHIFTVAAGTL